jgi:hypothetical protein
VAALVAERFSAPLAKAIYENEREFRSAINDALYELEHPEDSTRQPAVPVFDRSWPRKKLDEQEPYDLEPHLRRVVEQGLALLRGLDRDVGTDELVRVVERQRVGALWTERAARPAVTRRRSKSPTRADLVLVLDEARAAAEQARAAFEEVRSRSSSTVYFDRYRRKLDAERALADAAQELEASGVGVSDLANSPTAAEAPAVVAVEWSRHVYKGFYARAFYGACTPGRGFIEMNRLVCSGEVQPATIEFLLWHEYLHILMKEGHTPHFRALERLWPNHVDAERELTTLDERFDMRHWW